MAVVAISACADGGVFALDDAGRVWLGSVSEEPTKTVYATLDDLKNALKWEWRRLPDPPEQNGADGGAA